MVAMKKTANQIADEVIEKVAMPFHSSIKGITRLIAQQKASVTPDKGYLKTLEKMLKDAWKDQAGFEKRTVIK